MLETLLVVGSLTRSKTDVIREEVAVKAQIAMNRTARTRTQKVIWLVAAITMLAGGAVIAPLAANRVVAAETPKAEPTAKPAEAQAAPAKPAPISLEDYLAGVSKPGLSASDQAAFAKKHAGTSVTWTGYVHTVSKNVSPNKTSYYLILKAKPAAEAGAPPSLFVAEFSDTDEEKLFALQADQKVTVSGTVEVGANPAIPSLGSAQFSGS